MTARKVLFSFLLVLDIGGIHAAPCTTSADCTAPEECCPVKLVCEVPDTTNPLACGDPHMTGFRGQKFDFTGEDGKWYCLVSDWPSMHLNMRVTTPVPSLPEITYITGISVVTTDSEGYEHSIVIEVTTPHSLESACPTGVRPCLADGALSVFVDGTEELLQPGTVPVAPGVVVSAANLPGACRSFGFEKYWGRKRLEYAQVAAGRKLNTEQQSMGSWVLGDPTATNMEECREYVAMATSANGEAGLFEHQSEHASFQIVMPTATVRLSHGRLYQLPMRDQTDRFDLPEHTTWQMNLALDRKDASRETTGILGETVVPTLDDSGEPIMQGMGAIRGSQEDSHGRGAGAGRSSASRSSSPGESTAKDMRQLQGSLKRHKGKDYDKWAAYLLKEACGLRKIAGFSKSKDVEKMGAALTQLDIVMGSNSPCLADLEDKAGGGTAPSKPPASEAQGQRVPEALTSALRTAISIVASPKPTKMFECEGKSYTVAAILAAIKEEDRGGGDDDSIGQRRKSKHCVPRCGELFMHPLFRGKFASSKTQLSKRELDAKQTGAMRDVHIQMWEKFKDNTFEVANSFANDSRIFAPGIDPNIVHQPDISFQKFTAMKTELFKDHGEMYTNFNKSGSNGEICSFCRENLDTYYFGLTAEKCPDILAVCSQMLPDGTERENTGVGRAGDGKSGAEGASADAAKRKDAKVESKRNAAIGGIQQKKQKKQEAQIENTARAAIAAVKAGLSLNGLLGGSSAPTYADAPTSFYDTKGGCESKAAELDYSSKLRAELKAIKNDIKNEKDLGSDADEEDLKLLRDRVEGREGRTATVDGGSGWGCEGRVGIGSRCMRGCVVRGRYRLGASRAPLLRLR
eukprot:g11118.t1